MGSRRHYERKSDKLRSLIAHLEQAEQVLRDVMELDMDSPAGEDPDVRSMALDLRELIDFADETLEAVEGMIGECSRAGSRGGLVRGATIAENKQVWMYGPLARRYTAAVRDLNDMLIGPDNVPNDEVFEPNALLEAIADVAAEYGIVEEHLARALYFRWTNSHKHPDPEVEDTWRRLIAKLDALIASPRALARDTSMR